MKQIEVDETTTIGLTMVGWQKWLVTVNGVELQSEAHPLSGFAQDIRFELPDGRKAVIAHRPQPGGGPTFDARVGDRELIDPGKQPFTCPMCRTPVRSRDNACGSCAAPQPSARERIWERCWRSTSRGISLRAMWMGLWLALVLAISGQPVAAPARGDLHAAQQSARADGAQDATGSQPTTLSISIWVAAVLATFGCALLAKRAPVEACWVQVSIWTAAFGWFQWTNPLRSYLVLTIEVFLLWTMWRMARYARASRDLTLPA